MRNLSEIAKGRALVVLTVTLTFIIVGVTGLMLQFGFFNMYVKDFHSYIGIAFMIFAVYHVVQNTKIVKIYLENGMIKKFALVASAATIFVLGLTTFGGNTGHGGHGGENGNNHGSMGLDASANVNGVSNSEFGSSYTGHIEKASWFGSDKNSSEDKNRANRGADATMLSAISDRVFALDINQALELLVGNVDDGKAKLQSAGISLDGSKTLADVLNKTSKTKVDIYSALGIKGKGSRGGDGGRHHFAS